VLQLASAAAIAVEVPAARRDARGRRLHDAHHATVGEAIARGVPDFGEVARAVRGVKTTRPSTRDTPAPPAAIDSTRTVACMG